MDDFQERAAEMNEQEIADVWEQVKREQAMDRCPKCRSPKRDERWLRCAGFKIPHRWHERGVIGGK